MSEDKGGDNIRNFPGGQDISIGVKNTGGKMLQFTGADSITNNGEKLPKDKELAVSLGEELVVHPIGIPGGFLDTVTDQFHDPQNDFKSLGRLIIEGGAYGLLKQTVPALTDETRENVDRRHARLAEDYAYLRDAVSDRVRSNARPMLPLKPSEINSSSKSNIGMMLDEIELVDSERRGKFLEAKAQRLAQEVLGVSDGDNHPMLDERIAVDRVYLEKALEDRKDNHSFTKTKYKHLQVVK